MDLGHGRTSVSPEHPSIEESAPTNSSWGRSHKPGHPSRLRRPLSGTHLKRLPVSKAGAEAPVCDSQA